MLMCRGNELRGPSGKLMLHHKHAGEHAAGPETCNLATSNELQVTGRPASARPVTIEESSQQMHTWAAQLAAQALPQPEQQLQLRAPLKARL